jgi:hypothetical protein
MALPEEEKIRLLGGNWKIRTDKLSLMNYEAIENIFDNQYPMHLNGRYITCDAARLGNDFTVTIVWYGWKIAFIHIMTKNDANEAVEEIEKLRKKYNVIKGNVIIDQDGVGAGIVKLGSYLGFSGKAAPLEVREVRRGNSEANKEPYANRKTQFYYRLAERVNQLEIAIPLNNENIMIDGVYGVKMKHRGKVVDVREFIKADLRAIKKEKLDPEGKYQINSKEQQKIILKGRSPDFGDAISLRVHFDIKSSEIVVANKKSSILDAI